MVQRITIAPQGPEFSRFVMGFDVMNMRGVPLTASDVFKAKSVAAISPVARTVYATRWDDIIADDRWQNCRNSLAMNNIKLTTQLMFDPVIMYMARMWRRCSLKRSPIGIRR